jgi:hypothetical protein
MKHLKTQKQLNESSENLNISDVRSGNFVNLQFEVIEYDNNMDKGDFFIDGDTIHCFSRVNGDIVIDSDGLWHNPNSIKKVVGQKLIK